MNNLNNNNGRIMRDRVDSNSINNNNYQDSSPCTIIDKNDIQQQQYKDDFLFQAKGSQSGFHSLSQSISNQFSTNLLRKNNQIDQIQKKKFFLAKRVNPELINEISHNNSPHQSQMQLQAITLNQLSQRKLSAANSPIISQRNSVSFVPQINLDKQSNNNDNCKLPSINGQSDSYSPSATMQIDSLKQSSSNNIQIKLNQNLPNLNANEGINDINNSSSNPTILKKNHSQNNSISEKPNQNSIINPQQQPTQTQGLIQSQSQNIITKKNNIFNQKALLFEQKGPRYDEYGNIISRSIAGKVDWYTKKEGNTIDRNKLNEISGNNSRKNGSLQKQNSFSTVSLKKSEHNKTKHKWKHMSNKITKRQLLDQIDLIKDRIKTNQENEFQDINDMLIDQKISYTRDMRIMNKHDQTELQWQKFIEKSSNEINRDLAYSMLIRQDQYRNMREATEVFNICKTDLERYGPKLWEMTLRKQQEKKIHLYNENEKQEPTDLIITSDLPYAFYRTSMTGEKKILQFIRKPLITDPVASIMNNTNNTFRNSHQKILNLKTIGESMQHQNNLSIIIQNQSHLNQDQLINHEILDSIELNTTQNQDTQQQQQQSNDVLLNSERQNLQLQQQSSLQSNNNYPALNQSKFNLNANNSNNGSMTQKDEVLQKNNNNNANKIQLNNQKSIDNNNNNNNQQGINKSNSSGLFENPTKKNAVPLLKLPQVNTTRNNNYNNNSALQLNQSGMSFMNSTFQTANQLQQPFKSFRSNEYYTQRLGEIKDLLKDYKTIFEQNVDYQGLAVIGESQFEREVEMVKRADDQTLFQKYKPEEPDENINDLF